MTFRLQERRKDRKTHGFPSFLCRITCFDDRQMKRITAILFCVLLACMNAQAQRKVKLKVLEKGTEQPVIAATVVYADNEALQNLQGSVTNVDGLAELKIPSKKTYYYKISYVGFVPATGKIEATETEKTVYLEEDHLGLNEVVVTGSRTARPIKMSPVTTQVLGGKQLVEAGYSNLQQALQQETPGLNIQKVGFGNEISMQGLDAPPRAVPDGRRAHDGRHGRESRLRAFQPARHRPYRDCKRSQQYAVRLACRRCGNQPYHEENDQTAFHRRRCALRTDERAQLQESATEGFFVYVREECRPPQPARLGICRIQGGESNLADRRMVQFLGCVLHVSGGE